MILSTTTFHTLLKSLSKKEIQLFIEENTNSNDPVYMLFFKRHINSYGVTQLTDEQLKKQGFNHISKLRKYTIQKILVFLTPPPKINTIDSLLVYKLHYIQFYLDRDVLEYASKMVVEFEKKIIKHQRFDYSSQLLELTTRLYETGYTTTNTYNKQIAKFALILLLGIKFLA